MYPPNPREPLLDLEGLEPLPAGAAVSANAELPGWFIERVLPVLEMRRRAVARGGVR